MSLLIDRIGELVTNDPTVGEGPLGLVRDAAVVIQDGHVAWVGPRTRAQPCDDVWDAAGAAVVPGFVESHSHLVFAGDRAEEFAARMAGEPYAAGGIRTTLAATRAASDADLTANLERLVVEYRRQGTTTVEVKSGYGQTVPDEERALRLAAHHTAETTLLAAHVVPPEFAGRADDYVRLVVDEMVPACAPHARWIDVFCERGAFDVDQSRAVLEAGRAAGLRVRVHANQLTAGGGVRLGVELGAASVDHCVHLTDADVDALASADTVATLLPSADFSTRGPYPDARRLLDAGVTVALGADCNPGTSYTTSLPFVIALAVRELGMTPAEAVWAATAGGARALRRVDVGHLGVGARADLAVLDAPSYRHLAYRPGVPLVRAVLSGESMSDRGFAPWTGRDDGPAVEHARWHTVTTAWGADAVGGSAHPWGQDPGVRTAVLVGFASDEGVRRNGGRVGAAEGPGALRAALANLSDPGCPVFDAGDVVVDDGDLEGGQIRLGEVVREILDVGAVPVVLGGGHAVAYGTYLGWAGRPGWGVLNLDAHFDLRVADRATSGTPFAQMAAAETAAGRHFAYSVAGIARASNTRALFDAADRLGVRVLLDEDCTPDRAIAFAEDAIAGLDRVHLSVDLDVLPAGTAPGVSAPAGLGVPLEAVWRTVRAVAASGKLGLLEVAELNPRFDVDGRTARTAARLIDAAVRG